MPTDITRARHVAVAAERVLSLTAAIDDSMLDRPTPCDGMELAALLAHVDGLSQAFTAAARKEFGPLTASPPDPVQSRLGANWTDDLRSHVRGLAEAWADPAAWQGMTQAGGVDLPAEVMGTVALSELVLHGWDISRSVSATFDVPDEVLLTVYELHHPPEPQSERDGMFGPVVEVPEDARLVDRLVGLAGRDPFWPHGSLS
ncbi:TIGR03086 family metal-binding protein [Gordonia terrae]